MQGGELIAFDSLVKDVEIIAQEEKKVFCLS